MPTLTTRLAPSPTGALHLGNARTFLINWLHARASGWRIVLRVEDLDGPRIKPAADQQALDDLRWLGLDWDQGPVYQSHRAQIYARAIQKMLSAGQAYPCVCSRREVEFAASAPHAEDGAAIYPGTCRERFASVDEAQSISGRAPAIRFRVPPIEIVTWHDAFAGPVQYDVAAQLGDFVIAKSDGTAAYQLAVVIDDAEMGITHIVRGNDLLDSTPRQILLYRTLGMADKLPQYYHLPLVTGPDGRRLAKRHGDTRLSAYRQIGVRPGRLLSLLARWSGIPCDDECRLADLVGHLDLAKLPPAPIVFTDADHAWLLAKQ